MIYFQDRLGKYTLVYLTPELLLDERKTLLESADEKGKLRSAATVNRYMASLSGVLTYACRHLRWMNENPCFNLIKLKENPNRRRILTDAEAVALLKACRESSQPYLYCIVLMAMTTGMRLGEILNLTWDAIDFNKNLLLIKTSKNGRSRYVAIMDSVLKELESLHQARDPLKPIIFASKTAFGCIDIKKSWQKALKSAGIDDFVFHGLRHHYASRCGQHGASSQHLRSQLGHSSSQMTDHYTHLEAQATRYIGETIEKFDVDRIRRGHLHVPALCLSIFGSIQPGPITQYIRSAVKGGIGNDGFIQRFQITVWPDVKPEWELVESSSITSFEEPIKRIFDLLDGLQFDVDGQAIHLEFSSEAQVLFDDWQFKHENRLRNNALPPHMESHLAKYKKLLPALCLILEHLECAVKGIIRTAISKETITICFEWLRYFESHAERVYASGSNSVPKTDLT